MRMLVFGKNGQVARCLRDEAGSVDLVALGSADCDLTNPGAGAEAVRRVAPDIVVNAAGYTAVDKAETERETARRLNAEAPAELAAAARASGARFFHLSTDYVFDGSGGAYTENAATAPLNVYGKTKRDSEIAVLAAAPDAIVMRTSWVFSEYGANFVKTMLHLGSTRDALRIVEDQIGGPTPARAIARAILAIASKLHRGAAGAGVYHYQGVPVVSWADFAQAIFEVADLNVAIRKIPTSEYPTPARRPLRTVLDCARIERDFGLSAPDWRSDLFQVVDALQGSSE